jgi:ribosome-associated heat shock protein Hsp15
MTTETPAKSAQPSAPKTGSKIRVDKWLWHARFFKTRTLAAKTVSAGKVRVNDAKITKTSHLLVASDVLTFTQGRHTCVIRVELPGTRRGPAPEAQTLYTDLSPPRENSPPNPRFEGKGRPTKKDRRNLALSRGAALED